MYKLSIPVMNNNFDPEACIPELKRAGASRVFLAVDRSALFNGEVREKELGLLSDNLKILTENGFEVGVWLQAFGFGNKLAAKDMKAAEGLTKIKDIRGEEAGDAFCPTDERFTKLLGGLLRDIAQAGAKMIMLDDDLCLSVRPGLGCICDTHMEKLGSRTGENIKREDLAQKLFCGAPNHYRDVWFDLMGDTLREFCGKMREYVDSVDENIRLGFCAGYTSWDIEGADAIELTKILAGRNRVFLRLTGAPYWISLNRFPGQNLQTVIESVRMQLAWCENEDIEVFSENDSFPRPRYHVPAALVECFDIALRVSGEKGSLKYMLDYFSSPSYETGYIDRHQRNLPLYKEISRAFDGKEAVGVRVYERMHKVKNITFPENYTNALAVMQTFFSPAQCMLTSNAIPTVYSGKQNTGIAFGVNADFIEDLPNGLILDFPAALYLWKKGIDVGITDYTEAPVPLTEYFPAYNDRVQLFASNGRYFEPKLKSGTRVLSIFESEDKRFAASYFYENAEGKRFLVFSFDGYSIRQKCDVFCSYLRQKQLTEAIPDLRGSALPALCTGHPGLYMICKRDEASLSVALLNIFEDEIFAPEIILDNNYSEARFIGCEGEMKEGKVVLKTDIKAYGFAGIELHR